MVAPVGGPSAAGRRSSAFVRLGGHAFGARGVTALVGTQAPAPVGARWAVGCWCGVVPGIGAGPWCFAAFARRRERRPSRRALRVPVRSPDPEPPHHQGHQRHEGQSKRLPGDHHEFGFYTALFFWRHWGNGGVRAGGHGIRVLQRRRPGVPCAGPATRRPWGPRRT